MKILFIAMPESIHTARWINQIKNQDWDLYLYPSLKTNNIHPLINKINICIPFLLRYRKNIISKLFFKVYREVIGRVKPDYYEKRLYKYIKRIKPDIIHTLETQSSAYLLSTVKKKYFQNNDFPIWWHTNWGSDIYLFGKLIAHKGKIQYVLNNCDYYSCECNRDVQLAKKFGYKKSILPVYPNIGGFDLKTMQSYRDTLAKPSKRKTIMLKGYQGWAGRALVAIRALTLCKEFLNGYKVIIYSCTENSVEIASELFHNETGIDVEIIPFGTANEEIIKLHGTARISIGLSISDSISISVLESMAMGSFPVQSFTSAADEWITDKESGLLVPPEDPDIVAKAIEKALSDDALVDRAAEINWESVINRLDFNDLKQKTIASYNKIIKETT